MMRIGGVVLMISTTCFASQLQAQQCQETISATAAENFFEISQPAGVTDKRSHVIWSRCSFGQQWQNNQCIGSAQAKTYRQARQLAQKRSTQEKLSWRLPSLTELSLLVELRCHSPAINISLFPNTPIATFWTSTRFVNTLQQHWQVQFRFGANHANKDSSQAYIRLVRDKVLGKD